MHLRVMSFALLLACLMPASGSAEDGQSPAPSDAKQPFDPAALARLLDNPDKAAPVEAPEAFRGRPPKPSEQLTGDEIVSFKDQVSKCWSPLPGASDEIVKVQVHLNRDGTVAGIQPHEMETGPGFRLSYETAMRAVESCQPYDLPEEKYAGWQSMVLTFDAVWNSDAER